MTLASAKRTADEVLALARRCLRAARRCPTFANRELMRVYSLNRFRDALRERDPARVRRLMSDGLEEVARFEALQAAIAARTSAPHAPPAMPPAASRSASSNGSPAPASWDAGTVGDWLDRAGLGTHRQAFAARGVRGPLLLELDDEDLQELQIASRLERKRLLAEIRALRPAAPS